MITWREQGAALVGVFTLADGRPASVVLVGHARNTKGATILLQHEGAEQPQTVVLPDGYDLVHPRDLIDILCRQEQRFGESGLPAPANPA